GRGKAQQHNARHGGRHPGDDKQDRRDEPGPYGREVEDPVRVGRIKHLFAGLQDFIDITRHHLPLTQTPAGPARSTRNRLAPDRFAMYTRVSTRAPQLLNGRAHLSLVDHWRIHASSWAAS